MSIIATSEREIIIYYYGKDEFVEKTLAIAKAEDLPILDIDVSKTQLTTTELAELAERLNVPVKALLKDNEAVNNMNLNDEDWLKYIQHHPELMHLPIALKGNKITFVDTPTDVLKIF